MNTLRTYTFKILAGIIFLIISQAALAQRTPEVAPKPVPTTRILFIFDASQSMLGRWQSDTKFNYAKKIMSELLDSLANVKNLELALRLYGHQNQFPPQVCTDTKLEVPFAANNSAKIKARLRTVNPKGTTPLAYSLEQSANDFPPCANCRNIVVLITDGIEECSGDPCAVSQMLQKNGIVLKPFIIGIGHDFNAAFHCVGTYFDATNEKDFKTALNVVISQALNSTTMQVNLLDEAGRPTETDVPITFTDTYSGKLMYNFVHTMNNKGVPDTLIIDPLVTYTITAHTIPPVTIDSVIITPGKHTVAGLDTPQGTLQLKMSGNSASVKGLTAIVRQKGRMETINIQAFGDNEKYITGKYDLEILSLPRLKVFDVDISQSHTTTVEIPESGIVVLRKSFAGYGSILLVEPNKLTKIYDLNDNLIQETLYLQPGNYRVVFRPKNSRQSIYTMDQKFTIESGKTTEVQLYK